MIDDNGLMDDGQMNNGLMGNRVIDNGWWMDVWIDVWVVIDWIELIEVHLVDGMMIIFFIRFMHLVD